MRRPRSPPIAEATSSGKTRRTPIARATAQASSRYGQETGANVCSAANGARVACIAGPRQERLQYLVEHHRITPADLDLEHLDAAAQVEREPHPVLCRRDEPRICTRSRFAQPGDLDRAIGVVVRKS